MSPTLSVNSALPHVEVSDVLGVQQVSPFHSTACVFSPDMLWQCGSTALMELDLLAQWKNVKPKLNVSHTRYIFPSYTAKWSHLEITPNSLKADQTAWKLNE